MLVPLLLLLLLLVAVSAASLAAAVAALVTCTHAEQQTEGQTVLMNETKNVVNKEWKSASRGCSAHVDEQAFLQTLVSQSLPLKPA